MSPILLLLLPPSVTTIFESNNISWWDSKASKIKIGYLTEYVRSIALPLQWKNIVFSWTPTKLHESLFKVLQDVWWSGKWRRWVCGSCKWFSRPAWIAWGIRHWCWYWDNCIYHSSHQLQTCAKIRSRLWTWHQMRRCPMRQVQRPLSISRVKSLCTGGLLQCWHAIVP